ncbi:MAG: MerR family transcriptional regulator [Robiginitomaculum sp.]|nr:MerR family transcriptional regulator [Robiginitomaculum sp.]
MLTDTTTNAAPKDQASPARWTIAETALHFDITTRAIRFYEDKGLISPARAGGHRVFCDVDKGRIEKILRAKRIGFSLDDIKEFLDVTDGDVREREELLERKARFEAVIKRLRRKRRDIEIVAKDMQDLCAAIDNYIETAPKTGVFQFADAYDAMFRARMGEDFIPV